MNFLSTALGQLKKGFELVALVEMCLKYMGEVEKGVGGGGSR